VPDEGYDSDLLVMVPTTGATHGSHESVLGLVQRIAEHHTLADLMNELARGLTIAAGTHAVALHIHDAATDTMKPYILGGPVHEAGEMLGKLLGEVPSAKTPLGQVFRDQVTIAIPDLSAEPTLTRFADVVRRLPVRSTTLVPLTTARQRLGVISFLKTEVGEPSPGDLALYATVAKHLGLAVEGARHLEHAQALAKTLAAERDRLRALVEVNKAIVSELDLVKLVAAIGEALRETTHHDYVVLVLHDVESDGFRMHALVKPAERKLPVDVGSISPMKSPWGVAFRTRKPFVANALADLEALDLAEEGRKLVEQSGVQSVCAIPLVSRGRPLGALAFGSSRPAAFDDAMIELLSHVTSTVAPAVDNALAYGEIARLKDKLAQEKLYLEGELANEFHDIVGESPAIKKVLKAVETVAPTDSTVLILGETGTGKELVARAIHNLSGRKKGTFVKLNCAAIPTGLLESELFGHEKGAFTGALNQRIGRFELADGGTLFLDEVGDIPAELQAKLLRVLQEQEFERLGGNKTIKVSVRLVAATNRDLAEMVAQRTFRSDLYFRLNVFPISLPALRDRQGDVELLVRSFVERFARKMNKKIETIATDTMAALRAYAWPGNVRELENVIERALILSEGPTLVVPIGDLTERAPARPQPTSSTAPSAPSNTTSGELPSKLDELERATVLKALEDSNWQVGGPRGAAVKLGISRTTLQGKMKRLGINRPD
jgi:formate hydrogenlyase transcriptional activator